MVSAFSRERRPHASPCRPHLDRTAGLRAVSSSAAPPEDSPGAPLSPLNCDSRPLQAEELLSPYLWREAVNIISPLSRVGSGEATGPPGHRRR